MGALGQYLQFPKTGGDDEDENGDSPAIARLKKAIGYQDPRDVKGRQFAQNMDRAATREDAAKEAKGGTWGEALSNGANRSMDSLIQQFGVRDDKATASVNAPPSSPVPQSLPNGYGVPSSPSAPRRQPSYDDDIQGALGSYKQQMGDRPQRPTDQPPQMGQLPQRQKQNMGDVLSQAFAGAGNIFSAGSGHPQDYLGQLMNRQQGLRDQAYNDQLAQVQSHFQNEQASYSDKFQKYALDLRDHEQRLHDMKNFIDMSTEQKYLGKSPMDQADQQKAEAYRQMFDKNDNLGQVEEMQRSLKATRPPTEHRFIDAAAQGKSSDLKGKPEGVLDLGIRQITGTEKGRGFFESPQGPINQGERLSDRMNRAMSGKSTNEEKLSSLRQHLDDPEYAGRRDKILEAIKKLGGKVEEEEPAKKSTFGEKLRKEAGVSP